MRNSIMIVFLFLSFQLLHAQDSRNAEVRLTAANEPGKPFELAVTVFDIDTKKPLTYAAVFAYQTNAKGDYERDGNGVARINGTAYSNARGNVTFYTIYPRGYNDAPTGEHMHFKINAKNYAVATPTLMFSGYRNNRNSPKNPKPNKVYLQKLQKTENKVTGKAVIYLKRQ